MIAPAEVPMVEPFFVPETPFDGLAGITLRGAQCRASLYIERPQLGLSPRERIIVAHLLSERAVAIEIAEAILLRCGGGGHG